MTRNDRETEAGGTEERTRSFEDRMFMLSTRPAQTHDKNARYLLGKDLLEGALDATDRCIPLLHVLSWNVAEPRGRRFEHNMPIWYSQPLLLEPFLAILHLREALQGERSTSTVHAWDDEESATMWGQFMMGIAHQKRIVQVDLAGSDDTAGIIDLVDLPEDVERSIPRLHNILISRTWLDELRSRHAFLRNSVLEFSRSWAQRLGHPNPRSYLECSLQEVFSVIDREQDLSEGLKLGALEMEVTRALMADVDAVVQDSRLHDKIARLFATSKDRAQQCAFVRQMILQAYLCPCPDRVSVVAFIPDVSYMDMDHGEISSIALEVFLPERLQSDASEWKRWASLVSLLGRGKTVHDYSRKKRQEGLEHGWDEAAETIIHHLKTGLSSALDWLAKVPESDLASLPSNSRKRIEIARRRLREDVNIVQSLYLANRRHSVIPDVLTVSKLAEIFNAWRTRLLEENTTRASFNRIPNILAGDASKEVCRTVEERVAIVCQEVIINLAKHADSTSPICPALRLAVDGPVVAIVSEHICTTMSFKNIIDIANHRNETHLRGIGLHSIEILEKILDLPIWTCEVIDEGNRLVRLSYPVARIEEGGTDHA
jgi:hypothetical protein